MIPPGPFASYNHLQTMEVVCPKRRSPIPARQRAALRRAQAAPVVRSHRRGGGGALTQRIAPLPRGPSPASNDGPRRSPRGPLRLMPPTCPRARRGEGGAVRSPPCRCPGAPPARRQPPRARLAASAGAGRGGASRLRAQTRGVRIRPDWLRPACGSGFPAHPTGESTPPLALEKDFWGCQNVAQVPKLLENKSVPHAI